MFFLFVFVTCRTAKPRISFKSSPGSVQLFAALQYISVFLEFLIRMFGFVFLISPCSVFFSADIPMHPMKFGVGLFEFEF